VQEDPQYRLELVEAVETQLHLVLLEQVEEVQVNMIVVMALPAGAVEAPHRTTVE
jgi:hypothetical protein